MLKNKLNELTITVRKEQEVCGFTEVYIKILKTNANLSREEITDLEIQQRLKRRFEIETNTEGTTKAGMCSINVLYDKEIEASKDKILKWTEEMKKKSNEGVGCSRGKEKNNQNNEWNQEEEKEWWNNHYAYQAPEVRGRLEHIFGYSNMYTEINQVQNDLNKPTISKKSTSFKRNI